ncbi:MAG: hypothetical protein ACJA01_003588 [Saprospiraceae bacterium]|jgi:hypothetical protein
MNDIEGQHMDQMIMISLEQMVHPESFVRVIDAFVGAFDLGSFEFLYYKLNGTGIPPYKMYSIR